MLNEHFIARTACPCCESTRVRELRSLPYADEQMRRYLDAFYADVGQVDHVSLAGAVYTLMNCEDCGLVYQREVLDDFLSTKFYNEWLDPERVYELYERHAGLQKQVLLARQVETSLRYFDAPPGTLKVLDFGMGWGRWCLFARAYGCETYGLEISPDQVAFAGKHGVGVLAFRDLGAHTFDLVNAEQVFEHLASPLETLRDLAGCLRPGGLLWLAVPNGADVRQRIERWDWNAPKDSAYSLNPVAPLEHVNCFNHDNLVGMAVRAGLSPVEVPTKRPRKQPKIAPPARRGLLSFLARRGVDVPTGWEEKKTEIFFTRND